MTRVIRKTVRLHPAQAAFCRSAALYRALVGGRGSGKTYAGAYDLIRRARRGQAYMIIGPTYQNLRDSSMRTFLELAREFGVLDTAAMRLSAPPQLTLTTGAEILFRSGDDPEKLRGPSLGGAWLDEASLMPRSVYDIMIAALRDKARQGWLSATFTPKGPTSWVFDVFATGKPDTHMTRAPTYDNPFLPPDFADTLRKQYGEGSQFTRQEIDAEFVSLEGAEWGPDVIDKPGRWFTDWPQDVVARVIALDPSKGVRQDSDLQAFAIVAMDSNGTFWVDVSARREGVEGMIARGIELCRQYQPDRFVVEDNDGLGMLATEFRRQLQQRFVLVPLAAVRNTENKVFRLRGGIGGYLYSVHPEHGPQLRIRDTEGGRLLVGQMRDFPLGSHDDAIDALELALRALGEMFGGVR